MPTWRLGGVDGRIVLGGPARAGAHGGGGGRSGGAAVRGRPLDRLPLGEGRPCGGAARGQADGRRPEAEDRRRSGHGAAGVAGGGEPPDPRRVRRPACGADGRARPPVDGGPGAAAVRPDVREAEPARGRAGPRGRGRRARRGGRTRRRAWAGSPGVPGDPGRARRADRHCPPARPRPARAPGEVPRGPSARLSVLGALGREGMATATSVEAAAGGAVFHARLGRVLRPKLRRTRCR